MRSDFSIPCPSSPRRVTLPDVLIDHPFGRYWCCARKMGGYKDVSASVPVVFEADTDMYRKYSKLWEKWEAVINAIECDKPGRTFLELSVRGANLPKRLIVHALNKGAANVLRAFYEMCPKTMQPELPIQTLLFYLVSSCKMRGALRHVRMLAEIFPNLIRDAVDARGNTALWYTLYREAEDGPAVRKTCPPWQDFDFACAILGLRGKPMTGPRATRDSVCAYVRIPTCAFVSSYAIEITQGPKGAAEVCHGGHKLRAEFAKLTTRGRNCARAGASRAGSLLGTLCATSPRRKPDPSEWSSSLLRTFSLANS